MRLEHAHRLVAVLLGQRRDRVGHRLKRHSGRARGSSGCSRRGGRSRIHSRRRCGNGGSRGSCILARAAPSARGRGLPRCSDAGRRVGTVEVLEEGGRVGSGREFKRNFYRHGLSAPVEKNRSGRRWYFAIWQVVNRFLYLRWRLLGGQINLGQHVLSPGYVGVGQGFNLGFAQIHLAAVLKQFGVTGFLVGGFPPINTARFGGEAAAITQLHQRKADVIHDRRKTHAAGVSVRCKADKPLQPLVGYAQDAPVLCSPRSLVGHDITCSASSMALFICCIWSLRICLMALRSSLTRCAAHQMESSPLHSHRVPPLNIPVVTTMSRPLTFTSGVHSSARFLRFSLLISVPSL